MSGKSSSLRNLNPETTFVISVTNKALPFRGARKNYTLLRKDEVSKKYIGNYLVTADSVKICNTLKMISVQMKHVKTVVVEDQQYLMAFESMDRSAEKSFDKYNELASHYFSVLKAAEELDDDVTFIMTSHADNEGDIINPSWRIKTLGKILNKMITIEGLFTYVLFTEVLQTETGPQYKFITNSDGTTTAKTPMGMYPEKYIDNDIQAVLNQIKLYNEGE